jgi:hypothetical protein
VGFSEASPSIRGRGFSSRGFVANFIGRAGQNFRTQSTLGTVALYWHFVVGLWICLFGLLLIAIQELDGSANGNRTRISALKGPRANRCTIAPE